MSKSQIFLKNATEFVSTKAKLISGEIPKTLNGNYFRNGPGLFNYEKNVGEHWFNGDGYILKLGFKNGECTAQGKFVQTPIYQERSSSKILMDNILQKIWRKWVYGSQSDNIANTNVLCLKDSNYFLATCEGGQPYLMKKQNLKCEGFTNFGWITSTFSAHPKIDPQNGDIYNIGMIMPFSKIKLMKCQKDMKFICENQFKLRQIQSFHDFCLAGNYIVMFEGPLRFNLSQMIFGNKFFTNCHRIDENLPTLVHIFTKQNLQHVKTIKVDPFYSFHFTNGFSTNSKIVLQYVKYDLEVTENIFKLVSDVPKFTQSNFKGKYLGASFLQQMTIDLKDFSIKTKSVQINGDFPICEDHEVGKQWRYTYAIGSKSEDLYAFDTLYKYDRVQNKLDSLQIEGEGVRLNEPCLIRTSQKLYIMCIVNKRNKTYANLYEANQFKTVCEIQLPQYVPPAFHGKWDLNFKQQRQRQKSQFFC